MSDLERYARKVEGTYNGSGEVNMKLEKASERNSRARACCSGIFVVQRLATANAWARSLLLSDAIYIRSASRCTSEHG